MSNKKEEFKKLILRRLKGIKLQWENAVNSYNNIDDFLIYLNALIQDLRNITFVLQKHKKLYKGFDEWYGLKQEGMRSDKRLKWLHDSRNKIVKEEDLKLNSIAKVTLSNWLDNKLPDLKLDPFLSNEELVILFLSLSKTKLVKDFSNLSLSPLLQINRIWIDEENSDVEILEVINYGYNYFSNLIYEFFQILEISDYKKIEINLNKFYESKEIMIDIKTGGLIEKSFIKFDIDKVPKEVLKKAEQLFGELKMGNTGDLIKDKMLWHLDIAKKFIENGENLLPTCFFYDKKLELIEIIPCLISGRTEKYAWLRNLAQKIKNNSNIFNVIIVNEAWTINNIDNYKNHIESNNPSLKTANGECIQILFINNKLNIECLTLPFIRKKGNINYKKIEIDEKIKIENILLLKPIFDIWNN